ncbi:MULTISPECIES: hypothetical protein [unclassified Haloferax]|uniref:hypothetical protein n=1 Tax=Haloferax TaxID=2251 RepID=UPI0002AF95C3|nr:MULTISPECIES: hypothetical protein [unclassified Haloferax]ELZ61130.1 hypothetical protein C459_15936 [Haloferax sp. ATCC BAA-645]ELZ61724.1 hypothetical protein C460_00910 [Haloferax sp. ATCC BAA-646]ELZ71480.1 hypothetical protein C458_02340 [Haloferax sp. ATCC BAA-644]
MRSLSEITVSGAVAVASLVVGLVVAFDGPQVDLAGGVVWTSATGMVLLHLRGKVRDARSDESPEPGPLLRLAEIDYDPRYDRYLGVVLFALGIAAFAAVIVVDTSGWNVLFLVGVGNCCLIAALGAVALSDR